MKNPDLKNSRPPTPAKEIAKEIANTIVSEIAEKLSLMDEQLTWIDFHSAAVAHDEGLITWPTTYDKNLETLYLQRYFESWTTVGMAVNQETVDTLLNKLHRLRYALYQYRNSSHQEDRAYFAFAAGRARDEIANTMQALVAQLQKGISDVEPV